MHMQIKSGQLAFSQPLQPLGRGEESPMQPTFRFRVVVLMEDKLHFLLDSVPFVPSANKCSRRSPRFTQRQGCFDLSGRLQRKP